MVVFLLFYDAIDQYCETGYDYGKAVRLEIIDIFRPIGERPLDYFGDSGENAREGCDGDNGCHDRAHLLLIFLAKGKKSDDGQREEHHEMCDFVRRDAEKTSLYLRKLLGPGKAKKSNHSDVQYKQNPENYVRELAFHKASCNNRSSEGVRRACLFPLSGPRSLL